MDDARVEQEAVGVCQEAVGAGQETAGAAMPQGTGAARAGQEVMRTGQEAISEQGKATVLLGVTGCIASYKACEILRGLQKAGLRVKVVMTEHATHFVGPTTFRALTHEPVAVDLFDDPSDPIHHISLAQEADLFLIAPCTANVLAKLACGIADDLLTTTALATTAPILIAPAMNVHMFENEITQRNMRALADRGVGFVQAEEGYLACGDVGRGRLADTDVIVQRCLAALAEGRVQGREQGRAQKQAQARPRDLEGLRVMVTAGPTEEPIDPVRVITNRSSGKTGYALARAAQERGAQVTLISGPVALDPPEGVELVKVRTAQEMLDAAHSAFECCDLAVFTAAVADVRPAHPADHKLKKDRDSVALKTIELEENPDILATLAAKKRPGQVVVGFAAETDQVLEHASEKLVRKHADLIVANQVWEGLAFGTDTNKVWLVSAFRDEAFEGAVSPQDAALSQSAAGAAASDTSADTLADAASSRAATFKDAPENASDSTPKVSIEALPELPKRELADVILNAALALRG